MNPDSACPSDFAFHPFGVHGDPLPEFVAVFPAPNHSEKESRKKKD
jgi:hypothetical protein